VPGLAIVQSTHPGPGRPVVRITRAMPDAMTPAHAIQTAKARASANPGHRFRVLQICAAAAEPLVLWDSHAPS
jgi:hypothetical protein